MTIVRCLYCDAENDALTTGGYCDGCGHKLPPASLARRRRLFSAAGSDEAVEEERPRPARQAANLLFSVAVLQVVAGGLLLIVGPLVVPGKVTADFLPRVIGGSVLVMLLFAGLGWWALHQPFPASVAGIVLLLPLALLAAVLPPSLALCGLPFLALFGVLLVLAVRTALRT
jgi:hypothetical protein